MSGWPAALVALFSLVGQLVAWLRQRAGKSSPRLGEELWQAQRAREAARESRYRKPGTSDAGDRAAGMPDDRGGTSKGDRYRRD
jgi:hypothetical protein